MLWKLVVDFGILAKKERGIYMKRIIGILLAIVLTSSVICSTLFTSYAEESSSTSVSSSSSQTTDPTNPPVEGDAMTGDGEIA